jgi:putative hemolysin
VGQIWLDLVIVLVLLVIGGLFTASELALVSLRAGQLQAIGERGKRGRRVVALAGEPTRYLAAVQIGSIVAGFFAAAFGAAALAEPLAGQLASWGMGSYAAESLGVVLVTLLVTFIALVVSELTPRRYAMQRSEGVAMLLGPTLDRLATLFRPVIWVLSRSTNLLLRLLGADPTAFRDEISTEELRELVMSHEGLPDQDRHIVREVFAAGDRQVRDAMLPRTQIDFLDADLPVRDAVRQAWEHAHSRYPVTDGSPDKVIGFVHVRDMLDPAHTGAQVRVRDLVRNVMVLPATKPLLPSLSVLQGAGAHMAMVVDEYGSIVGIVTLENLVEKLVGDIYDEYDVVPTPTHGTVPSLGEVDGLLSLNDFRARTGVELPAGPYDTVGGLIVTLLGHVPGVGDEVDVAGHTLAVSAVDGWRVHRVVVSRADHH